MARHLLVLAVATLLAVAYGTRHEDARDRGLPPPPAGPQPPLGPGLADPDTRAQPGRRPALPVSPRHLKSPAVRLPLPGGGSGPLPTPIPSPCTPDQGRPDPIPSLEPQAHGSGDGSTMASIVRWALGRPRLE
ncbi:MAG: hypothetical protein OXH72_05080, partial [Caldilineaceae bacterium]|nr:hypothetical protein [Caldilineaceae bacterium]